MSSSLVGPLVAIVCVLLTIGGTIAVALLRKPVDVTALWAENRLLGSDKQELVDRLDKLDEKFTAQLSKLSRRFRVVGDAFVAQSNGIERAKVKLVLTPDEERKIEAGKTEMESDLDWPTMSKETK